MRRCGAAGTISDGPSAAAPGFPPQTKAAYAAEAPDDASLSAALLVLGAQGNLRTTTMRAFTADEFRSVIESAG